MEAVQALIPELRSKFLESARDADFHPKDIARANDDDHWLKRFLLHHDSDVNEALKMMLDTCEWRKNNKVNDISEATLNMDYLKDGSLFVHNRDKDGKSLLIFKCSKHVKGQRDMEELKKIVIYWFERVERQDKGEAITVFFDMTECGLSNMDLDYTQYLINLCKLYYPYMLNYILIFEMPFILNAAFKIIKTWLPAKAVQKIKFVNKNNLKDYVETSQALKHWGGTDSYVFTFEPVQTNNNVEVDNKKKVHFASPHSGSGTLPVLGNGSGDDSRVRLKPSDAIEFNDDGLELTGTLAVKNISETPIMYKVKTTAPEKFRVRSSTGTLGVGERAQIIISTTRGVSHSISKDKFLVLTLPIPLENVAISPEIWKTPESKDLIREYRVRCRLNSALDKSASPINNGVGSPLLQSSNVEQKMSQLLDTTNHLHERLTELESSLKTFKMVIVGIFLLILAVFYVDRQQRSDTCRLPDAL